MMQNCSDFLYRLSQNALQVFHTGFLQPDLRSRSPAVTVRQQSQAYKKER
jgi:hypothetical protein